MSAPSPGPKPSPSPTPEVKTEVKRGGSGKPRGRPKGSGAKAHFNVHHSQKKELKNCFFCEVGLHSRDTHKGE